MSRLIRITLSLGLIFILVGVIYSTYQWFIVRNSVRDAVRDYNEIMCQAYFRPDPELVDRYSTPQEKARIKAYILYLYTKNKVMRCTLNKISFISVKVSGDKATVRTKERWVYQYLNAKTKKELGQPVPVEYDGVYILVRQSGRWLVDSLEANEKGSPGNK